VPASAPAQTTDEPNPTSRDLPTRSAHLEELQPADTRPGPDPRTAGSRPWLPAPGVEGGVGGVVDDELMARRPVHRRPTARRRSPTPGSPPGPAPGPGAAVAVVRDRAAALAELERLYTDLPDLACKGLCGHSCTQHIDASTTERDQLLTEDRLDLDTPTPDRACPAHTRTLAGTGSCTVHPHRPMICRLWGIAASMPCPHGRTPTSGHPTHHRHPDPAPHQPGNRRAPPHRH